MKSTALRKTWRGRRTILLALVAGGLLALAPAAHANLLTYIPITGDGNCKISTAKAYTHALDFGTSAGSPATVRGVPFTQGLIGSLPPNFSFQVISGTGTPNHHAGNGNHNVTGNMVNLMTDMIYTGGNSPGAVTRATLSGLSPGAYYDARIYTRAWGGGAGTRVSNITFDPDGAGPVAKTRQVNEDNATADPPSLDFFNHAYAISYKFQAQQPTMTIDFQQLGNNQSWHLYGLTNEETRPLVTSLYSSGLDANHDPLAGGTTDPHWWITRTPAGPTLTPALRITPHPAWLDEDQSSGWIGVQEPGTSSVAAGNYDYLTTFSLASFNPSTAVLMLRVVCDDVVDDVLLNGVSTGFTTGGHTAWSSWFPLTSGFQGGTNTLEFLTRNGGVNPHGLRVEMFLYANLPEPTTLSLLGLGSLGLLTRRRRRC